MRETAQFATLDVLIVEPSAVQAKIIGQECQKLGILRIHTVQDGKAALDAMRNQGGDVVLSALYLPDMSGTDLVRAMRTDPELENKAFILISSETRPQALEPVRQSGACGILPKPFTEDQLARAFNNTVHFLSEDTALGVDFDPEELRVLLVDDSPNARKFIRRVMENLGIRDFCEANNGKEAITILGETMVDLVVTDYNMPEMDGQALVSYIRQQSWQQSVPILMVTSETDYGRLAAVEEAGVSGICDKPFDPTTLRQVLAQVMVQR